MNIPSELIVLVIVAFAAGLLAWQFLRRNSEPPLATSWNNIGQGIYGSLAAIAIAVGGFLFLFERQWSPRLQMDLKTDTYPLPAAAGARPEAVLIRATIAIKNQGRTAQSIDIIEIGVDDLSRISNPEVNRYGDVQGTNFYGFKRRNLTEIEPQEVEYRYLELPVSCRRALVRLLIKVPRRPYEEERPPSEDRHVYERKALIPLTAICSGRASLVTTPFLGDSPELMAQD